MVVIGKLHLAEILDVQYISDQKMIVPIMENAHYQQKMKL